MLGGGGGMPPPLLIGAGAEEWKISSKEGGGAAACMVVSMLDVAMDEALISEFIRGSWLKDPERMLGLRGGSPPEEGARL